MSDISMYLMDFVHLQNIFSRFWVSGHQIFAMRYHPRQKVVGSTVETLPCPPSPQHFHPDSNNLSFQSAYSCESSLESQLSREDRCWVRSIILQVSCIDIIPFLGRINP